MVHALRSADECSVLSIAGSDCSGGAGIQADLKTFAARGCYGASAITALTIQNTTGVQAVHPCPPDLVAQQVRAVLDDIDIHAIKTGMLYDSNIINAVVEVLRLRLEAKSLPPVVCDPVCVSTSGHTLLNSDAIGDLIVNLFPLTTLITPNKSEASLLLTYRGVSSKLETLEEILVGAECLSSISGTSVLLKGGHLGASIVDLNRIHRNFPDIEIVKEGLDDDNMEILRFNLLKACTPQLVIDVLYQQNGNCTLFVRPRINTTSTHGTGCTLSAAISCGLARGLTVKESVKEATVYTHLGIVSARAIGKGNGPLNHLHSINPASIPRRTSINPYPLTRHLIQSSRSAWKGYVEHDFVRQLGKGTLARQSFVHFIKQDYHYLKYYARAYGLLAAKSASFRSIESSAQTIMNIINELDTHKAFCASFGVTRKELEASVESVATTAYGAYILNIGLQGDHASLTMALMACLLGYGEVGLWLKREASCENSWVVLDENPYKKWIDDYSGDHYQDAVKIGLETLEQLAETDAPSQLRLEEWQSIWLRCTQLEKGFWDMSLETKEE